MLTEEDKMCCLCKHKRMIITNFYCGNIAQKDGKLKKYIKYNYTCQLFEERIDDPYTEGNPILPHKKI